jgi:hypothetical protein
MPFAPLLARLAKADVGISTTLLVVLTAAIIVALPLGLPLRVQLRAGTRALIPRSGILITDTYTGLHGVAVAPFLVKRWN